MIRALLFAALLSGVLARADALGGLVQPDGSVTAVGQTSEPWGATYTFPLHALSERSWIILPPGTVSEATLVSEGRRTVLSFPSVHVPGMRFAVEVPPGLLSLALRGTLREGALARVRSRPGKPGEAWVTRSAADVRVDLPRWSTPGYVPALSIVKSDGTPWTATVSDGKTAGLSRTFEFRPSVKEWGFFPAAWGFAPARLTVTSADAGRFDLRVRAYPPQANLSADPATLLTWPKQSWRSASHEWFLWAGTSVLVLVAADYAVQDAYLKRLAFFVEKTGYRGRLVTDAEVAHLHGWNAHDYSAADLARFFSLAAQKNFPLNTAETELRDRLVGAGILKQAAQGWEPGVGALVGISAASPPALRAALFVHEAFHGLYYTSDDFRAGVKTAWDSMSEEARAAFRDYLALSRYDPSDEALMVNEFQAYILQRRASDWLPFFSERILEGVAARDPRLAEYLTAAQAIETVVTNLYGLHSGEVSLVSVSSGGS